MRFGAAFLAGSPPRGQNTATAKSKLTPSTPSSTLLALTAHPGSPSLDEVVVPAPPAMASPLGAWREDSAIERRAAADQGAPAARLRESSAESFHVLDRVLPNFARVLVAQRDDAVAHQHAPSLARLLVAAHGADLGKTGANFAGSLHARDAGAEA
jgi:hypothetical protein